MKRFIYALVLVIGASGSWYQETQPKESSTNPSQGFEHLKPFLGKWSTAFGGTMTSKSVGKKWIINEIDFPTGISSVQTLGYDPQKEQIIGTWIDSTSNYLWQYKGSVDEGGKKITLESEGPDMQDASKLGRYRDIYEFVSEDEIAASSQWLNHKEEWQTFSKGLMTRKED